MITLHASPLQGFTDFRFRSAFIKFFGGIDQYIAPYIRINGNMEIKAANIRDIAPANNPSADLIPQLITNDANEFLFVASYVKSLGYKELNWNLGCPYPMVAKRGMGSGLLADPAKIGEILNQVSRESEIRISVKMRLGYESAEEIFRVLPVLEKYKLENIAIHPRIGKQLYKGEVDLDTFEKCCGQSTHLIIYNGDITSLQRFRSMKDRFPGIDHWMIGRGLIADPFLPAMIKADKPDYPEDRFDLFLSFHNMLFSSYQEALSGSKHLLMKMYSFWVYFIQAFPGVPKGLKKIRKAQSISAYNNAVQEILREAAINIAVADLKGKTFPEP